MSVLEQVLNDLAQSLAVPTDEYPSVRCVTRPTLTRLLTRTLRRGRATSPVDTVMSPGPTAASILARLESSSVVRAVPLDRFSARVAPNRFLTVGLTVTPDMLDGTEILQAHATDGVICYFSALGLHELTTQPVTHHHIARVRHQSVRVQHHMHPPSERPAPLGQWQFTRNGLRFYLSMRESRYLSRTQWRFVHELSRVRVTTLEQTLLDTLHRPMSCGGPAVVFEAWDVGCSRLDHDALALLLTEINDARLTRRVGYMLAQCEGTMSARLASILSAATTGLSKNDQVPLLSGLPYSSLDPQWHVLVP
jgi:predicted transcriptional regulator of viral defense system